MQDTSILDTLMAGLDAPVCIVGANGAVTRTNPAFTAVAGQVEAGQAIEALGETPAQAVRALLGSALGQPVALTAGRIGSWETQLTPIVEGGAIRGCIIILRDAAVVEASVDGLDRQTGLPDKGLFLDRLDQALLHAGRAQKSVAVILVGIERLDQIIDLIGSDAGDGVLGDIAERLRQCVRVSDTVARLDKDRFAFAMQITAINDSVLVTEKILKAFAQPFRFGQHDDVSINCVLGVSIYPTDSMNARLLVQNATVALHHAAQLGSKQCQFFSTEMNTRARQRLALESGIRRALERQEFVVYYQPKIDVKQRRVAGMEALVRWRDPERGLIPPGEFIPVAEESGLIETIGQWVLETTCAQNKRWQEQGLPAVRASVNVSARQFRNPRFVGLVEQVLEQTGLEPRWLELEITESMLMGDIDTIVTRMEDLRKVGVSLSIDDFGTGYSSLSYLSRFPITTLKIDRAFINDVQSNPQTAEITRAIIGLSRGLNLEVVAEGAEVVEQIEFLREHGCELVQGFYYSRPLPAEEFARMLREGPAV